MGPLGLEFTINASKKIQQVLTLSNISDNTGVVRHSMMSSVQ
jgi:hypothetical protein